MITLKNGLQLETYEATRNDAFDIIEYTKQVGKETSMLGLDEAGIPFTELQEAKLLERVSKTFNNCFLLGRINGLLVSVINIMGVSRKKLSHNVSLGMSVLKDYFNLGIGTIMLNSMIQYCKKTEGIKNIILEVRSDNEYAIKMYKKAGFKKCGRYTNMMKIDDMYYDCIIMELLL